MSENPGREGPYRYYDFLRDMITLALVMVMSLSIAVIQAHAGNISFPGVITTTNPCTGDTMTIHGTTTLSIGFRNGAIMVSERFSGRAWYWTVLYSGWRYFSSTAPAYYIPIGGKWVRPGGISNSRWDSQKESGPASVIFS